MTRVSPASHPFCQKLIEIEVFVDVQGDKYLARIVKTFPPKTLPSTTSILEYHPLAANLNLDNEEVLESDDPMKYFYSARLIVEGSEWVGSGEEFEGSLMEVQADKIS
jgi:bromodomain adjacent to zinc finger domain protein 1A